MTIYRMTEQKPEGAYVFLPRLCVFCQVIEGTYNEGAVRHLIESEIGRRGIRWNGTVGFVPSLPGPVDLEL